MINLKPYYVVSDHTDLIDAIIEYPQTYNK